jgi:hypothetical protein
MVSNCSVGKHTQAADPKMAAFTPRSGVYSLMRKFEKETRRAMQADDACLLAAATEETARCC